MKIQLEISLKIGVIALSALLCSLVAQNKDDKCTDTLAVLNKTSLVTQQFPPQNHCNVFVGMAVKEIYNIDDFVDKKSQSGYLLSNAVSYSLFTSLSEKWEIIGTCDKQSSLDDAQKFANSNRCVIAAWKNPDDKLPGHVCLIMPGKQQKGWVNKTALPDGMLVPVASNFAQGNNPKNNFVCGKLSGAFSFDSRKDVVLFVHKE